jgi:hypothetical protein
MQHTRSNRGRTSEQIVRPSLMSDQADASKPRTGGRVQDQRKDRLKLALRENLKRRKAQVRGRNQDAARSDESPGADVHAARKGPDA